MSKQVEQPTTHAYIRRRGRMTKAQSRAFEQWTADYHVSAAALIDQDGQLGLEIGFGMGQALVNWAREAPDWQLCGIELYQPGIGALTDALRREDLHNVAIIEQPAQQVVAELPASSVSEVRILFPDPWPKKRHHKRRLIQPEFVTDLARIMVCDGIVHLATDWTPYADWMRECFAGNTQFALVQDHRRAAAADFDDDGNTAVRRETTKFERRGERLGHDIHDLIYRRLA